MNKVTKVKVLKKPLKKAGQSALYLDFYPPLTNPETGKQTRREFLNMWVFDNPKSKDEREHNRNYLDLSDKIKAKRELDIHAERFDFLVKKPMDKDFLAYFGRYVEELPIASRSSYAAVLGHLKTYSNQVMYSQIIDGFCEGFRKHLLKSVAQNSAALYYSKFKSVVNQLVKVKEIAIIEFKAIKSIETQRQYLTSNELQKLIETDCRKPIYKNAALFSAMTGLRFSDVIKLVWGEVRPTDKGFEIAFRQQKTKFVQNLPLNDTALALCGTRCNDSKKVFDGVNVGDNKTTLPKWLQKAGITKDITFHCFRHTNATLLLNSGIDIYTVSKMLGHKDLKTTEIYAKLTDERKRSAANMIDLKM